MSRALSVHQGKGATHADAQLGAMLEAVESDAAERFDAEGPVCSFAELPERERAPCVADFAADRARPPAADSPLRWVEAEDLLAGGSLHLPFDLVSLDFTRAIPSALDRASNGVATGASRDEAIATALCELIERDSVTEWRAEGLLERMTSTIDPDSVPFGWFRRLEERIAQAGASLRCYRVPSPTGAPVFAAEINDLGKDGRPYRAIHGGGCHPIPEIALFKALAEAVQGRATYVAGARDDMLPSHYRFLADSGVTIAFGLPLPPGMDGVDFATVAPGPAGAEGLAEALARAGYGRIAVIDLARPHGFAVVRAFVCGLASLTRRRRLPLQ